MKYALPIVFALALAAPSLAQTGATYGAWPVPGTTAIGYIGAGALTPEGKIDGQATGTVGQGALAVVTYDFSVGPNWPKNATITPDAAGCRKIEAEILKHKASILGTNFPTIKWSLLKPVPVPDAVLSIYTKSNSVNVTNVIEGTSAPNTKCLFRKHTPAYGGVPLKIMLVATYRK